MAYLDPNILQPEARAELIRLMDVAASARALVRVADQTYGHPQIDHDVWVKNVRMSLAQLKRALGKDPNG
jgi:hypothetical protein